MNVKKIMLVSVAVLFLTGSVMALDQQKTQKRDRIRTQNQTQERIMFVDENGDGINDLCPNNGEQKMVRNNKRSAERNGSRSKSSFRNQFKSSDNTCDGTGPKGKTNRRGRG